MIVQHFVILDSKIYDKFILKVGCFIELKYSYNNTEGIKDRIEMAFLPRVIPIALSKNEVLLPGNELLLPIEGAYSLTLLAESLKSDHYMGIVQLKTEVEFYETGTIGKILDFKEMDHDKICILIEGITRFDIIAFEKTEYPYVKGVVEYKDQSQWQTFSRERLKKALMHYFFKLSIEPNWDIIDRYSDQNLVQYLLNFCPFESIEKQCLLEADSLHEQCSLLTQLLELSFSRNRLELSMH